MINHWWASWTVPLGTALLRRLFVCSSSIFYCGWADGAVSKVDYEPEGGGGGVLPKKLGRGVRPAFQNRHPIYNAWFNSTCYHPPPGTPPGICVLDVLFPTPGHTERDNSPPPGPMTWTKNKLLRFDDLFLYLNKTRNLKNPKLLEQLTPFRSKANIIKLDTHTHTLIHQEGVSTKLPRKLKCTSTKQLLKS